VRNQAMSVETMAARHGLSPDHEQQLIARRADVREANFNPNEPRDERGRWTTMRYFVDPSDATGGAAPPTAPFPAHIDTTPPPLSAERQAQLDRASRALDQLVKDGKISRQERDLRYEVARAALGHRMGYSATEKPSPAYFDEKKNSMGEDEHRLRPGLVADGVYDRVYRISGVGSNTGCERASQMLMLEGQAQLAKKEGKSPDLDKEVAGKTLDDLYPAAKDSPYQAYTAGDPRGTPENDRKGVDTGTFVPGDRVWMKNHRLEYGISIRGGEGSNVIYVGRNGAGEHAFAHMEPADLSSREPGIETEKQMQTTVRSYTPSVPGHEGPDKPENYKFQARYAPKVAPSIKSEKRGSGL
jgi:hypothetical protein